MKKFWDLEHIGIEPDSDSKFTLKEQQVLDHMKSVTRYDPKIKRWWTKLLWQANPTELGNNLERCRRIAKHLYATSAKQGRLDLVEDAFLEFFTNDFAEFVDPPASDLPCSYIPTHAVFRFDKSTTRTRIVMNCSSITQSGKSLNSLLPAGPCLLQDFPQILMRFRAKKYAFATDISKMFLQILMDFEDRDYQRFIFIDKQGRERHGRMKCLVFGSVSSPFQSIYCILQLAQLFEREFPLAKMHLDLNLYVDDIIGSCDTIEEAQVATEQLRKLLLKANFHTHKWSANDTDVLKHIPVAVQSTEQVTKVLGQVWNIADDTFKFSFTSLTTEEIESPTDTKRTFLRKVAKMFDPLGFISPFVLCIKLLFQNLWLEEKDWDDNLGQECQAQWNRLKSQIPKISELSIPRKLFREGQVTNRTLVVFCDASESAYAACVYLVTEYTQGLNSSELVFSKARVAPVRFGGKKMTPELSIVRLELLGMEVGANILTYVRNGLAPFYGKLNVACFTDSQINLYRLQTGSGSFKTWVGNRLKKIENLTSSSEWRHVKSQQNSADIASRGTAQVQELISSSLWWKGPDFLSRPQAEWPQPLKVKVKTDDPEAKFPNLDAELFVTQAMLTLQSEIFEKLVKRFSSWKKLQKLFLCILRMSHPKHKKFRKQPRSVEEDRMIDQFLFLISQRRHFFEEMTAVQNKLSVDKSSSLVKHSLIVDELGFLRTITRFDYSHVKEFEERRPIVLAHHCPIVELYVLHLHDKFYHAGPTFIMGMLNREFYLVHGKKEVKRILLKCFHRGCLKPVALGDQQMAPLPATRIDNMTCYHNVSVDLFGPIVIKAHENNDKVTKKVYGCIFTCLVSRGIHLELMPSMGTDAFLDAFRKFCARKGCPTEMYSDNALYFKAADKELRALFSSISWSKISNYAREKGITWTFSVPLAPFKNGVTERLVQTVKRPLRKLLAGHLMTFSQLEVILIEIEAMVNCRPLAELAQTGTKVLTPSELHIGRPLSILPLPKKAPTLNYTAHWKRRKLLMQKFWSIWQHEYLNSFRIRKRWTNPRELDLLHKLVITNDKASFNEWKIGRIIRILPSKDNLVRNVEVLLPNGPLIRPIQQLSLIENYF